MKSSLIKIVQQVEKQLSGTNYGFKQTITNSLNKKDISFRLKAVDKSKEFDCLYYSIKGQELLKTHGIETDIFVGQDEYGLWDTHTHLKTLDGTTIDFSPMYKTIGANHKTSYKLDSKSISQYRCEHKLFLNQMVSFHYDKRAKLLFRIGVDLVKDVGGIKLSRPTKEVYLDVFALNKITKKYYQKAILKISYNYLQINQKLSFNQLLKEGIFEIERTGSKNISYLLEQERRIDKHFVEFLRKLF